MVAVIVPVPLSESIAISLAAIVNSEMTTTRLVNLAHVRETNGDVLPHRRSLIVTCLDKLLHLRFE